MTGQKKRIENPNDIVIRNPGQMRALISIFILQICAGAAARSELSSPKRCWQNLNFNADMQNEQWTQIENEIYYTLLHSIEWKIPSKEKFLAYNVYKVTERITYTFDFTCEKSKDVSPISNPPILSDFFKHSTISLCSEL